ncbi:MAG TPA: Ser-Thr-rich GPI-anchored membrane family protein [bacterium]
MAAVPAAAQTIAVTAPNGGETWTAGSSCTVNWTTIGDVDQLVTISLYKSGILDRVITPSIATTGNSGAYVWTIPNDPADPVAPGADYMIRVAKASDPTVFDESDAAFTIAPPIPRLITAPAGGEIWHIGSPQTITWRKEAFLGTNVNIRLFRDQQAPSPGAETIIVLNAPNNGSFIWAIPPGTEPGSTYRVKVHGVIAGTEVTGDFAYSDNYFSIVEPGFQVLSPNGGENWVAGTTRSIIWGAAAAAGADVRIELYKGGSLETVIAASTPNTGGFPWPIPADQPLGSNYVVRVTSVADPTLFDESDAQFTIGSSASIISYPVGGEVWVTGTPEVISWRLDAVPSSTANLYLVRGQSDPNPGGESIIILGVPNTGSFSWNIPKSIPPDVNYRVKLEYKVIVGDTEVTRSTYSDNYFTITQPSFQVLTPNGGENWLTATTQSITWMTSAAAGAFVNIDLYRGGALYSPIIANVANTGSYAWAIPAGQALGNDYTIRVTSVAQPTLFDESDTPFTIATSASIITSPVGGEVWLSGTSQTIAWQQGSVNSDAVSLYLVRGQSDPNPGGETIIILNYPNNGSFSWTVPTSIPPDSNYRVKLVAGAVETYSDNYFTITQPSFRMLAPNGGETWVAGMTRTVTWATGAAGATVRLDLYKSGAPYAVIANPTANTGSYTWSIPAGQTPGDDYTIRVTSITDPTLFDDSDGAFSIGSSAGIITSPIGGEVWLGGEMQAITWRQDLIDATTVTLALVKGQSDPSPGGETPIIANVPNNGSFAWTIPASILSDSDYRVKLVGGPVTAYSDNYFSIQQADLRVVSPNGGEKWLAGSTHTITWTTTGVAAPNVRIDLLKAGKLNSVISTSAPDSGSYAWTIRNEQNPGADYTIRVASLANAQVAGESFEGFTILSEPPYDIILSDDTAQTYAPIGTAVGTFSTLDPNPGDTFTYSLDFCVACDNASFRIAGNQLQTGEVFMTAGATKTISVTSTDQSGQSVKRDFKIHVVTPNQAPTDISLNDSVIVTGLPSGTRVGEFSSADPNTADPNFGETFLYTLVNTLAFPDNSDFRIVGNQLQTATIFANAATLTKTIRVQSTDKGGLFRVETFTITVSVNEAPVLAPIGNKSVNEGQLLSFTLSASDPNGDPLVFSASSLPSGATLTGAAFSWVPNNTQAGVYTVHFEVTDGAMVDFEDITITVNDVNPTLFFEQFTDGTSAGDTNWTKNAGLWTVTAGKRYRATSAAVTSLSTVKTAFLPRISAGRIEGLVRMITLTAGQNVMLVFSFQDGTKYRYVQLIPGAGGLPGEIRVGQAGSFGGVGAGIKARNAVAAAVATDYPLRIDAYTDGRTKVYYRGVLVLNYKFPTAVAGLVGVGVVRNGAEFDNFRVSDTTVLPAWAARPAVEAAE